MTEGTWTSSILVEPKQWKRTSETKQWSEIRYLGDNKPLFDYLYLAPFVLQKFPFQKRPTEYHGKLWPNVRYADTLAAVRRSPIRHILALQGCYELVSQEEANIHGNGRDKRIAIQDTEVKESFFQIKI